MKKRRIRISALIGAALLLLLLAMVLASFHPAVDPDTMGKPYQRPSAEHWLGTNDIGQDIFSELLVGSRVSLLVGLSSAAVVLVLSVTMGVCAGYFGGRIDAAVAWLIDLAMTIPSLPLTIVIIAYFGSSLRNIIFIICLTSWAGTARIVRTRVKQLAQMPFIKLEENMGLPKLRLLLAHILPNITDIVFIRGVSAVSAAILTEAGLSFLGLGDGTMESWGNTLHYAFYRSGVLNGYWWWYLPPTICICLCSLGFVLLGYSSRRIDANEVG
ncbi:MAG: ABC transporter permease [Oscillospiraceae bacterium]|nr:ABC transporter permease [Oscillospiraceae bacterium]